MKALTHDQKVAMLVVPILLFGILGTSFALAYESDLTEEQKSAIIEAHQLRESGNFVEARSVLDKAGVKTGLMGRGVGPQGMYSERREAIREAIDANDYDAFLDAVKDTPFAETMTKEAFETMVQVHELREEGKFEEARALMDEAGIHGPHGMQGVRGEGNGRGLGMGMGMRRGF